MVQHAKIKGNQANNVSEASPVTNQPFLVAKIPSRNVFEVPSPSDPFSIYMRTSKKNVCHAENTREQISDFQMRLKPHTSKTITCYFFLTTAAPSSSLSESTRL